MFSSSCACSSFSFLASSLASLALAFSWNLLRARTTRKMTKAIIRKSTILSMKRPILIVAGSEAPRKLGTVILRWLKSMPPISILTIGMTILFTREVTMEPKAPPTTTPMAKSTTLPRLMNSLNSLIIAGSLTFFKSLSSGFFMITIIAQNQQKFKICLEF